MRAELEQVLVDQTWEGEQRKKVWREIGYQIGPDNRARPMTADTAARPAAEANGKTVA
jgi:hypothetical protein